MRFYCILKWTSLHSFLQDSTQTMSKTRPRVKRTHKPVSHQFDNGSDVDGNSSDISGSLYSASSPPTSDSDEDDVSDDYFVADSEDENGPGWADTLDLSRFQSVEKGNADEQRETSGGNAVDDVEGGAAAQSTETAQVHPQTTMIQDQELPFPLEREKKLPENSMTRDKNVPEIYVKKFEKVTSEGHETRKTDRPYDLVHSCFICRKLRSHIQDHLESQHGYEPTIKEIIQKKLLHKEGEKKDKVLLAEITAAQDILRYRGDHNHNLSVIKHKSGELLISRRGVKADFDFMDYGPCPYCQEWMKIDSCLSSHQSKCKQGPATDEQQRRKGNVRLQAEVLMGRVSGEVSERLKNQVFPIMKKDEISEVAQKDTLILALGDAWLSKAFDNKLRRKYYSSFRMRLAARLLIIIREKLQQPQATMYEVLKPATFDAIAESALDASVRDNAEELKHPSVSIKLGFDVSRLASLKLALAIKNGRTSDREEVMDFISLVKIQWSSKVAKLARVNLNRHHFDTPKTLPHPSDIKTLTDFLVKELDALNLEDHSKDNFRRVANLTLARLITYNRRRCGEVEALG